MRIRLLGERRAERATLAAVSLFAALMLGLIVSLFANAWGDALMRVAQEEGDWHIRLMTEPDEATLDRIRGFAHVSSAVPGEGGGFIDIRFSPASRAYVEGRQIAAALGLPADAAVAHDALLSALLVLDPSDPQPSALLLSLGAVALLCAAALAALLRAALLVCASNAARPLALLESLGATPRQLRRLLVRDALLLCLPPAAVGLACGVALSAAVVGASARLSQSAGIETPARFALHPPALLAAAALILLTLLLGARLAARRLARFSLAETVAGARLLGPERLPRATLCERLFGPLGLLASRARYANRNALRAATFAFALALFSFSFFSSLLALGGLSTRRTYFERYASVWDVMARVEGETLPAFAEPDGLRALPGAARLTAYQRVDNALLRLPWDAQSDALLAAGGLPAVTGAQAEDGVFALHAPLLVLDDESFSEYARETGSAGAGGAVIVNAVRDSLHSPFYDPTYVSCLRGDAKSLRVELRGLALDLPVAGLCETAPPLREEYDGDAPVIVVSAALYAALGVPRAPQDAVTLCAVAESAGETGALAAELAALLPDAALEQRPLLEAQNARILRAYDLALSAFCALPALVGMASVFFAALGFSATRAGEFSRLLALGMTPQELRVSLALEGALLVARPALLALLGAAAALVPLMRSAGMRWADYWAVAPVRPVACLLLFLFFCAQLAYALAARRAVSIDLASALREEV